MAPSNTQDLVHAASGGEQPAIDELLRRFLPRLHLFVRLQMGASLRNRETSADLVQSVCVDLLSHLDGFRYEGEEKFVSWLFSAAVNKVREKVRFHERERRDGAREVPIVDSAVVDAGIGAAGHSPSRVAMGREELERLETAFAALPEDYREVVVLARLVGLPHAAIAERLGRTEQATRKLLGRALTRLGELTGGLMPAPPA